MHAEQTALETFRSAAVAQAAAIETGNYKTGNEAVGKITAALRWMAANDAAPLLYPLLDSPDVGPSGWAAAYLLAQQGYLKAEKALLGITA